jgi:hypothetical protein
MPMNNMVLVLAKNGGSVAVQMAMAKAWKLVKQAAENKLVRTAFDKQLDAVLTAEADSVTAGGKAALTRPFANRKNRRLAVHMALQIGGTYDLTIIDDDWYWVVWQGETPFAAYPRLPEGLGPLAERPELKNYRRDRIDPSADSS